MSDIKLQVTKSTSLRPGQQFTLLPGETVIGRKAEEAQIVVPEQLVSRKHCVFLVTGNSVYLEDLKSGNGTYFNGKRLQNKTELKGGDKIQVGDTHFEVLFPSQASEKKAVPEIVKKQEPVKKQVSEVLKPAPVSAVKAVKEIKENRTKSGFKIITAIMMALLLVLGVGALYFLGSGGGDKKGGSTPPSAGEVNLVYSWVDGGCKFRHPEGWQRLQMYTEPVFAYTYFDHSVLFFGSVFQGEDVIFIVDVLKGMPATVTLEDIAKSTSDVFPRVMAYGLSFSNWKKGTLAGKDTIFAETPVFEKGGKKLKAMEAYILDQGHRYLLMGFTTEALFPQLSPVFQEMISSFELDLYAEEFKKPENPREEARFLVKNSNALVEKQDVKSENLYLALKDFRKAAVILNRYAFDVKDSLHQELMVKFKTAQTLLDNRYKDLKFKIERGYKIGDDESIYRAVKEIMSMIPNPEDERYKYAIACYTPELKEKFENTHARN